MKKSSNYFVLSIFIKNLCNYIYNTIVKKKNYNNFDFEENWRTKSSQETLRAYWTKKNLDIFISPLINFVNKNNIKNILEIGCAAGANLRVINLNCKKVENLYGTDFNKNFIDYGLESCKIENLNNINLYKEDIDSKKIFEIIKGKKIDLIITVYSMCQLKNAEQKISQVIDLIKKVNPRYLYFGEIFDFNNKIKLFRSIQENIYPDRIFLDYKSFKENLSNYKFQLIKENYNTCAVKFSHIVCEKVN